MLGQANAVTQCDGKVNVAHVERGKCEKGAWGREKREAFDLEKRCYGRFYNVIVEVAKLCSFFYSPLFLMCLACWRIRCRCCCCWVALRNCLFKHKLRLKTFKCVVRNARLHFEWNWTISGNSQIRVKGVKVYLFPCGWLLCITGRSFRANGLRL